MNRSKFTQRLVYPFAGLVVVALLTGMAWVVRGREAPQAAATSQTPVPVRITTITSLRPSHMRELTGIVEARHVTELGFRVGGKIEHRQINIGSSVRADEELFRLDANDYQLQLESAEAELAVAVAASRRAEADEQRQKSLLATRSISDDEYDNALSQRDIARGRLKVAQRALELARNRLSYSILRAPAAGVIMEIYAERGQMVAEGQRVAKLAHDGEREIVVNIPERWLDSVKNSSASVTYWSLSGVTTAARLRELSPSADPVTRTFVARFTIVDAPVDVQLGMTATLHLRDPSQVDGFTLPASALVGEASTPSVWKVIDEQGQIAAVPVAVMKFARNEVIVSGSLAEGDQVVTAGAHKLDASRRVRKWEELR